MSHFDTEFIWQDASDSDSSVSMSSNENNHSQIDYESETSKTYKKKLHKKLFQNDPDILQQNTEESDKDKSTKKRKIKEEPPDINGSLKKKKIKQEPDSEIETKSKRKRHTSENSNISETVINNYLNKKVKEEQEFIKPESPKVNGKDVLISGSNFKELINNIDSESITKEKKKKKKHKSKETDNSLSDSNNDCTQSNESQENISVNETLPTNSNDIEVNTSKKKKKKKKIDESVNNTMDSEKDETVEISAILNIDRTEDEINMEYDQTIVHNETESDSGVSESFVEKSYVDQSEADVTSKINKSILKKNGTHKANKISDKIRFEEEEIVNDSINNNKLFDSQANKFLKANPNLKDINKKMPQGSIITSNDEAWLLTVPSNITIDMLKGMKITIDSKCKMKINNESYVGHLNDSSGKKRNILSQSKDKLVINSQHLNGTIHLHRRLPKTHILDDNFSTNQNSFIPLPETKCRHPIFGPKYVKAMKIPSAIKQRLNESENLVKKHKKSKKACKRERISESQEIPKAEDNSSIEDYKKKKKKKRKHSKDDSETPSKKVKYEPDSVEAWESEKAIEENLFNF